MSKDWTVRRAAPSDVAAIARLKHALWPDETEQDHRAATAAIVAGEPASTLPLAIFVAAADGRVVGFAEVGLRSHVDGCDPARACGFLEGWFVEPEHQRRGLGRSLVERCESWAQQLAATEFGSDTWADNKASVDAHLALGFEVVDRCVNFRKALSLPRPEVRVASGDDWPILRALRLAGLAESPDSFAMTLAQEEREEEPHWRSRIESSVATLIAKLDGRDAGIATVAAAWDEPNDRGLYGVWVAPWARGRAVGDALVGSARDASQATGARRLVLEVGAHNPVAKALYERHGFVETGRTSTLPPPREHLVEIELAMELGSAE